MQKYIDFCTQNACKLYSINHNRFNAVYNGGGQTHYTSEVIQLSDSKQAQNNMICIQENKNEENLDPSPVKSQKNLSNSLSINKSNFGMNERDKDEEIKSNHESNQSKTPKGNSNLSRRSSRIDNLIKSCSQPISSRKGSECCVKNIESIDCIPQKQSKFLSSEESVKSSNHIYPQNEEDHDYPNDNNDTFSDREQAEQEQLHIKSGIDETPSKSQISVSLMEEERYNEHIDNLEMHDSSLSPDDAIQYLAEFILEDETVEAINKFFEIKQTRHPDIISPSEDPLTDNSYSDNNEQESMTDSQLIYPNESSENVENSDEENQPYNTFEERQRIALERLKFQEFNLENTEKLK